MSSFSAAATTTAVDVTADVVDYTIWKAIAGSTVEIPSIGSRVYYFPEGHAEHINNNTNSNFSTMVSSVGLPPSLPSFYLCRVLRVQFLADPQSEQVFAKLLLVPVHWDDDRRDMRNVNFAPGQMDGYSEEEVVEEGDNGGEVVSFAKVLTPSDANNGGGFSVPRFCADSIFPPLDFEAEPPVQNLFIRDVNGNVFEFRHIYRGTPRRHLLTTGWSKYVNAKKLVAGDSVVFMRKTRTGELFVGVRRVLKGGRGSGGGTTGKWIKLDGNGINYGRDVPEFWTSVNGRPVLEAMEMAAKGTAFEVLYYPRPGWADFVVNAELVERSMNLLWNSGVRVKMSMETEDSSRLTWSHGTVLSISVPDNGPWRGSPWRMLQVKWDEHDILKSVSRVSPWEVQYVVPTASPHSAFPPTKRLKVLKDSESLPSEEEELMLPMTRLSNSMMGHLVPMFQNYTSPGSIQGARQNQFCFSSLSNIRSEIIHPTRSDSFINNGMKTKLGTVSTVLNIGSCQSENLSPDGQSSVHYSGTEIAGKVGPNTLTKVGVCSFQLFGKIIRIEPPLEEGSDYIGCTEGESKKVYEDIEGINNPPNLSLTFPCSKLLDRLDVEACPL